MTIGDRVKVGIREREGYAFGCAACLDGAVGTVEQVKDDSANGRNGGPALLVRFDVARPTWFTHQTPAEAFWLPVEDLTAL